ncbi:MAG: hypothetical protein H6Q10_3350 [Acidobacteria bacterium]|nr:hypothetical protein [Acidobacteriota bacterium]
MRSFKSVGVLAAVLAALAAYVFFVERKKPAEPEAEARPKVFEVSAEKIAELMVRSGSDRTVVRKVDGQWRVVEPIEAKADEAEVSGITSAIATLENVRVVDEAPSDLAQYGLAKPAVEVGFRADGEKTMRHLRLGDKTPTQGEMYASRGGRQVFLVPSYLETSFAKSTFDLRDKGILAFARDKVDRVTVEGGAQPTSVVKSGTDWLLKSPLEAPADYGSVEGLIGRLETGRMTSIAEQQAGDLGRYGLDKPSLTVTVGAGSAQASLQVGTKAADGGYYARDLSRPLVFVVEASLVDELKKPADDLRSKDVFAFRPFNATGVELVRGTDAVALEKAKGPGKDAAEKWRRVKPAAGDLDQAKVDDLLGRLSNLRAESFQPPDSAAAKALSSPALAVTARYGEDRKQETVRFARVGADVYAGVPNQPGALKVPAGDFDAALKAIDALK